ncbi:CHAT domain-containing protein [Agromyces sp. SYSU T0242]|uniref:CHAT domain-containing protein n=1 Tax=Agromyces litoreus TaxID=3158561 RepID=UPI0033983889
MDAVLELEIGPGPEPGSYVVEVLRSVGGGEPSETFTLDLDALVDRRDDIESSVLASAVAARRVVTASEAAIQQVGRTLFESAFTGEVRTAYRTSVAVAAERGTGVQVALRLKAPGLAALPWEALFDPVEGSYLCRKDPLVRHVPAAFSPPALAIDPPLRILAMVSSPRGLPPLDVERERDLLDDALRTHIEAGRVEIEWLTNVTWAAVHDRLLDGEWHVLHFIGHGGYDTQTDEGVLAFVDERGRADYVPASSLADLLDEAEPTPRLVLLNSCESGAGGTTDLFSGTAAALARSGIHAVAAMQFSISDSAAIQFSRGFYSALAHGRGIDEAVRSGRIGILGTGRGTLEWVTPVLYLRGEDAHLFDIRSEPRPPEKAPAAVAAEESPDAAPAAHGTPAEAEPPEPERGRPATAKPATVSGPILVGAASAPAAWWTAAAATRPAPTPPPPAGRATVPAPTRTGSPPRPPRTAPSRTAGPPRAPASRTAATPPHRRRRTPAWIPWLLVALVGAIAIVVAALVFGRIAGEPGGSDGADRSTGDQPVAEVDDRGSGSTDTEVDAGGQGTTDGTREADTVAEVTLTDSDDWLDTGIACRQGDEFEVTGSGTMRWDGTDSTAVGIEGDATQDFPRPAPDLPFAALIGGLRMTANERFAVAETSTYVCPNAGTLWIGVNDGVTDDNRGSFTAEIRFRAAE